MRRGLLKGPVLLVAAVILAIGLAVIVSSFFREILPEFTADLEPLLNAAVILFFVGAAYFLVALVSLCTLKPTPKDEDAVHVIDGIDTRISFEFKDPATHVASSILILVGAAIVLTFSLARPGDGTPSRVAGTQVRPVSEEAMEPQADNAVADQLAYYAHHGVLTDPEPHGDLVSGLPREIDALVGTVQGLLLHVFWAEAYGITLTEERQQEAAIRAVSDMLARIRELDDRPLNEPRDLDTKLVANCRGYAVLLTAMLRHQGVPARARCGFGTYFAPGKYMDHWVCEYWNADQERWVMVDPQLDELQIKTLGITFDPLDVPPGLLLTGGDAWLRCRAGEADPDDFGIMDLHGMSFVRGNVGHDFWALNKLETLPWEGWGVPWRDEDELTPDDLEFLDRVSRLTLDVGASFRTIRALHEEDERLRAPEGWPAD